jgi:hypothetical protein
MHRGTDIHLGPGQEKHLPHEAWHVVQQKQGRVKPTIQMKGKVNINDDIGLEKEADVMGLKAIQAKSFSAKQKASTFQNRPRIVAERVVLSAGYESAAESAKATDRNASNRTPEQLEEAYRDALAKGLDRFTKLDAQKEMAVDKEEKGKPQEEYVVQIKGEIIYNHKIQVGEGKNIHVVTQVFLKKGEGFVPENQIEEPKEKI